MATDSEKPAPKRRKAAHKKPSFEPAAPQAAATGWTYRTDAAAEPVTRRTTEAKEAAETQEAPKSRRVRLTPPPEARRAAGRIVTGALDAAAVPFGIMLMTLLAPLGLLRTPRRD